MKSPKTVLNLFASVTLILLIAMFLSFLFTERSGAISIKQRQDSNKQNEYPGPIVNYSSSPTEEKTGHHETSLRAVRASRYDKREPWPLGKFPPTMTEYYRDIHWGLKMSPLPLKESDTVIVGEVSGARAFLSNDKTGVFSEFEVDVTKVLHNNGTPVVEGSKITTEREGGVVRFEDGRLLRYKVLRQGLPRTKGRYLFFLKYNDLGNDYLIVTGYKLDDGRVTPLDGTDIKEATGKLPFSVYDGASEDVIIKDVRESILRHSGEKMRKGG